MANTKRFLINTLNQIANLLQVTAVDETTIWGLLQNNYKTIVKWFGCDSSPYFFLSFAIAMVIGVLGCLVLALISGSMDNRNLCRCYS